MKPFKLTPAVKNYIWGSESWVLSAHPDGQSVIECGEYKGMMFGEFTGGNFPILIKLINAKESLSIQVHPNDDYARRHENDNGKTEMWIVLGCKPDAYIYIGFEREVTREEFARRINDNTILEVLHKKPVKSGDVIFIPAGTIHAIGRGIKLAEVQQTSNVTYRVYDFGRVDADGNQRPLHIGKALDVIDFAPYRETSAYSNVLADCEYFYVTRLMAEGEAALARDNGFLCVLCVEGEAVLGGLELTEGDCVFIPAGNEEIYLEGSGQFIIVREGSNK